jgi:hypothetical protein
MEDNFKHYQNMVDSKKNMFMLFRSSPFLNFSSNLCSLYHFEDAPARHKESQHDLQSPRKLSQLIELSGVSPIIDKKNYIQPKIAKEHQNLLQKMLGKTLLAFPRKLTRFSCCFKTKLFVAQMWFQNLIQDWNWKDDESKKLIIVEVLQKF